MDPQTGGWHYNKNSDPPLDWDTSRDAAKYFRVVRWIDAIVANSYSPNEKDPSESPPIFVLPNGSLPLTSSSFTSSSTSADTALPPAGTQLPRQLKYFEIQGGDKDDEEPAGPGGRADGGQGWNAQLPDTAPAPSVHGKKQQSVWVGSKTFRAKGNFYELRVEKVHMGGVGGGGGGGGRAFAGSSVGSGARQGVPAAGNDYGNRSTTESFAEVASRAEGAAAAGRNGGGSGGGGRGVYTFSPRGGAGETRGRRRGRAIDGGLDGRGGQVFRRDGFL